MWIYQSSMNSNLKEKCTKGSNNSDYKLGSKSNQETKSIKKSTNRIWWQFLETHDLTKHNWIPKLKWLKSTPYEPIKIAIKTQTKKKQNSTTIRNVKKVWKLETQEQFEPNAPIRNFQTSTWIKNEIKTARHIRNMINN